MKKVTFCNIFALIMCQMQTSVYKIGLSGDEKGKFKDETTDLRDKGEIKDKNIPPGNAKGCRAVYGVALMKEADLVMERRLPTLPYRMTLNQGV